MAPWPCIWYAAFGPIVLGPRRLHPSQRIPDRQPVLVYQRRQHIIDLYIWKPTDAADSAVQRTTQQGFHLVHWTRGGLTYWAVSDLNREELETLVGLLQSAG